MGLLTAVEILLFDMGEMANDTGRCPICDCEVEIGHTSDCSANALEQAYLAEKGELPVDLVEAYVAAKGE